MIILAAVIFQGFIFLGMILIMRQFMRGHVSGAVDHLQKMNDDLIKQQNDMKEKMAVAQKEYEMKMNRLQQDVTVQQSKAREEAAKTVEDSRTRALAEREKIITEAVETREKMRKEIMAEMEEKSIQNCRIIISEFFQGEMKTQIHEALLARALDGLKKVSMENFQIRADQAAELRVPEALKPEAREKIKKILEEKIKGTVQFKEEIDPSLVAGIVLKFGAVVIDGSLTNRLNEAAARLKKETTRRYQTII